MAKVSASETATFVAHQVTSQSRFCSLVLSSVSLSPRAATQAIVLYTSRYLVYIAAVRLAITVSFTEITTILMMP